jgi:hypothetical protein
MPRRPEAHPDRHYHPRHFRKRSRYGAAAPGDLRETGRPRHRRAEVGGEVATIACGHGFPVGGGGGGNLLTYTPP